MKELTQDFITYQEDNNKVISCSQENYIYKAKSIESIANVMVTDFNDNIKQYEKWKKMG